jgi:hypothetical protein
MSKNIRLFLKLVIDLLPVSAIQLFVALPSSRVTRESRVQRVELTERRALIKAICLRKMHTDQYNHKKTYQKAFTCYVKLSLKTLQLKSS